MWEINYLCKSATEKELDLWYKLCVYYHAETELYDRTLTNLRSPYDPTEAYLQSGIERRLSYAYARKLKHFVNEMAIKLDIPEHIKSIGLNANKYHYSSQDWIDIYNRLVENGEMDFIEEEYKKYEEYKKQINNSRIEMYKFLQRL